MEVSIVIWLFENFWPLTGAAVVFGLILYPWGLKENKTREQHERESQSTRDRKTPPWGP